MQRLTYVVFIPLLWEKTVPAASAHLCTSFAFQPWNKTMCTHAHKIRKWRPMQQTAASECCEWASIALTKDEFEAMKMLSSVL